MEKIRQAVLYIGLNDADTHEQKFGTDKYYRILRHVCRQYHVAVSVSLNEGSYFHEDGTYVEEKTLVLTMMGVTDETVREIARDLCTFFNFVRYIIYAVNIISYIIVNWQNRYSLLYKHKILPTFC